MVSKILYRSALFLVLTVVSIHVIAQTKQVVVNKAKPVQSLSIQNDTTERLISVDKLTFQDFNKNGKLDVYEDYRKPIELRAKDLLSKMTTEEKLVQLQCPWIGKAKLFTTNRLDTAKAKKVFTQGLGAILRLSDGNYIISKTANPKSSEVAVLANETQKHLSIKHA